MMRRARVFGGGEFGSEDQTSGQRERIHHFYEMFFLNKQIITVNKGERGTKMNGGRECLVFLAKSVENVFNEFILITSGASRGK